MSDPVRFLNAFGHAMAVMTLYPADHPSREGAIDDAYRELDDLASGPVPPAFTFLEDEVVFGREPLRDMKMWDWGRRLVAAGIQRLELERRISRDEFDGFLQEILIRLSLSTAGTSENRQMRSLGIRFGAVGLEGEAADEQTVPELEATTLDLTLGDEAETLRWLMHRVQNGGQVPLIEAEAVVRSLSVAMHGDRRIVLPLLQLKEFDQYTTTHSLNVAVLAMGLAEKVGCRPADVRAFGVAGLLHDIGKTRIPLEILTKPGRLTDDEVRQMRAHPVEGARIIMQSDEDLDLAAEVAYEHHIMLDGGGYPQLRYPRQAALASRLVHVCDVFDALSTNRPYRDAWPMPKTLTYLEERAGSEFDPDLVRSFNRMLNEGEAQLRVLHDDRLAVPV
jgi:putative nucleotidyltransferase with HDIG domain